MRKKNLYVVGSGGHCNACLDIINLQNLYNIVGIIEKNSTNLNNKFGNIATYKDKEIKKISTNCKNFLLAIGKIGNSKLRENKYHELKKLDVKLMTLISPTAYMANNTEFKDSVHIMHHVLINSNVKICENTIINSQSLIEHDSFIGPHCHISTAVKINGGVTIGRNTFVGSGTIVHEGIRIGNNVTISAGSIINRDISDGTRYQ